MVILKHISVIPWLYCIMKWFSDQIYNKLPTCRFVCVLQGQCTTQKYMPERDLCTAYKRGAKAQEIYTTDRRQLYIIAKLRFIASNTCLWLTLFLTDKLLLGIMKYSRCDSSSSCTLLGVEEPDCEGVLFPPLTPPPPPLPANQLPMPPSIICFHPCWPPGVGTGDSSDESSCNRSLRATWFRTSMNSS